MADRVNCPITEEDGGCVSLREITRQPTTALPKRRLGGMIRNREKQELGKGQKGFNRP